MGGLLPLSTLVVHRSLVKCLVVLSIDKVFVTRMGIISYVSVRQHYRLPVLNKDLELSRSKQQNIFPTPKQQPKMQCLHLTYVVK